MTAFNLIIAEQAIVCDHFTTMKNFKNTYLTNDEHTLPKMQTV